MNVHKYAYVGKVTWAPERGEVRFVLSVNVSVTIPKPCEGMV